MNIKILFTALLLFVFAPSSFAEEQGQGLKPRFISSGNVSEFSDYLSEPVLNLIKNGRIVMELQEDVKKTDFAISSLRDSSLSFVHSNRYRFHSRGVEKNELQFLILDIDQEHNASSNSGVEGRSSLGLITLSDPLPYKNWLYLLNYNKEMLNDSYDMQADFKVFSPISKCRNINYENIIDPIFASPLSIYDFFPNIGARYVEETLELKQLFVPILSREPAQNKINSENIISRLRKLFTDESCQKDLNDLNTFKAKDTSNIVVNFDSVRLSAEVKLMKLIRRRPINPYLDIAFEILAIDPVTNLPHIKLVYDSSARFKKGVFYDWTFSSGKDLMPNNVLSSLLVFDASGANFIDSRIISRLNPPPTKCFESALEKLCKGE